MSATEMVIVYGLLSSYCLAGCLMEHFAVMPGWRYVGEKEFTAVHIAQGNGLGYVYVLPKIALTVLIATLLVLRPATMPAGLLWASAVLLAISWLVSFVIQFPIQAAIRKQKTLALVNRLYRVDGIRVAAMAGHNLAVWAIIARAFGK